MFETGKIYACNYVRFKNDPTPLLMVFHADNRHVEGLNVNYLQPHEQRVLADLIMKYSIMFSDQPVTGKLFYGILKRDIYPIVSKCYRKYLFSHIRGFLVSNGLREGSGFGSFPEKVRHIGHGFVRYLENMMRDDVMPLEKAELAPKKEMVDKMMSGVKFTRKWWQDII